MNHNYSDSKTKAAYVADSARIENSVLKNESTIYRLAWIKDSTVEQYSSVGDCSKVDNSFLGPYVRIGRFNQIHESIFGKHSYTGLSSVVLNSSIGKFNSISWNVSIGPANHDYSRVTSHSFLYNSFDNLLPCHEKAAYDRFKEHCILGHDVWVGAGSVILRNVTIGHGAVIGANSVVNQDIPPYSIAVGSPAHIIKYRFDDLTIAKLLEIEWWNFPDNIIRENFNLFSSIPDELILNKLMEIKKNVNCMEL